MCPLSPHTPLEEVVSTDLQQPSCYREACFYCVLCVQRSFHNHYHEGKGILRPKTACVTEVTYLRLCNTYNFLNVSCHFHTVCPWRGDPTTLQKLSVLYHVNSWTLKVVSSVNLRNLMASRFKNSVLLTALFFLF